MSSGYTPFSSNSIKKKEKNIIEPAYIIFVGMERIQSGVFVGWSMANRVVKERRGSDLCSD
jgi:hypothetical protein